MTRELENTPMAFKTERLNVYETWACPSPRLGSCERAVFFAFPDDDSAVYPVCTLTLWGERVEMIETHEFHRRRGFAKELIRGVEAYWGTQLSYGEAVSDEGDALLNSLENQPAGD